jgi:hypothetical protein
MAAETSTDAHLPVSIVLFKLHLELVWEKLRAMFLSSSSSSSSTTTTTNTDTTATDTDQSNDGITVDFDSSWDLYLMAALLGLIGALYIMRQQRAAFQRQPPPPAQ